MKENMAEWSIALALKASYESSEGSNPSVFSR